MVPCLVGVPGCVMLLVGMGKDDGSVMGADVRALAVGRSRVVDREEDVAGGFLHVLFRRAGRCETVSSGTIKASGLLTLNCDVSLCCAIRIPTDNSILYVFKSPGRVGWGYIFYPASD